MNQRPVGYNPEEHRTGFVYTHTLPGDHYEVFKQRSREQDPLSGLLCAGRKQEIGDYIQMCMGMLVVHIVIYKGASLKGIEILFKKIKYHVKKQPGTAMLSEFDRGILFDGPALQKKSARKLATEMFQLLKKRRSFLRLIIEQSHMGGALHEDWMHEPTALRRISRDKN